MTILNWSNGGFGLDLGLAGEPESPQNSAVYTNNDDLVGHDGDPAAVHSGDDFISGLGGNDGIDGGYGDDWIDGGHGNDLILGGPGSNRLIGGLGDDILMGLPVVMDWVAPDDQASWASTLAGQVAGLLQIGNGWYSYVESGTAVPGDASQNLGGFQIAARYVSNTNDSPWVALDPNALPNGGDEIDAGDGSDVAYGGEGDDIISGGTGNDLLVGGSDNDYIEGEDGNDVILGDDLPGAGGLWDWVATRISSQAKQSGNDVLVGGEGDDKIYGQGGNDVIDGGAGNDVLQGDRVDYGMQYSYTPSGVAGNDYIDGGDGDDQIFGDGGDDTLLGGAGADYIVGDSLTTEGAQHGADTIHGGAGNDTVAGYGGDDTLYGDDGDDLLVGDASPGQIDAQYHGNDVLYGGAGNDELQGNGGNDYLDGGTGQDLLLGQDGNDTLQGGDGNDELQGGAGNDSLFGGKDNDRLFGGEGDDYLSGDDGDDELSGDAGNDRMMGGAGNDQLWGGAGDDVADGGEGADIIDGNEGNDTLNGGAGDDQIDGDDGNDILYGGTGVDSIYGGTGNDVIYGEAGNDVLTGAEGDDTIRGGDGADQAFGSVGNDTLLGEAGDDVLSGEDGDDVLDGGAGNDKLWGGAGNDTFHFETGWGNDVIYNLGAANAGNDRISFGTGIDPTSLVYAIAGKDLIITDAMRGDTIYAVGFFGPTSTASLAFQDGTIVSHEDLVQQLGVGLPAEGTPGDDVLTGTDGNDQLLGGAGDDVLNGMGGDDFLEGGTGNDTLAGGAGNDDMDGGEGDDIYHLGYGFGIDRILNLGAANAGSDVIRFNSSLTPGMISNFQVSGDDLMVAFVHGGNPSTVSFDTLILEGFLSPSNSTHIIEFADGTRLTAGDFIGTGVDNRWDGTEGGDTHSGGSGADFLNGAGGNDTLSGAGGNDRIYGGDGNDVLDGGDGIDSLYGMSGNDELHGGQGSDYLDGGAGADRLEGGAGNDLYRADAEDTIFDADGQGEIYLGNTRLVGGTRQDDDPQNEYRIGDTVYLLNGTTLTVNGGLVIEQFNDGDFGIFLRTGPEETEDQEAPSMDDAESRISPLVVDLNGDGVKTVGYSGSRYFDHDANGMAESSAWVNSSDGLLVRDLNGNGKIDSGRELFGSNTLLSDGTAAANGFVALAELDDNHDGLVDAQDAAFSDLKIWRDANGNGITDSGELLTLQEAGIAAFRTQWSDSSYVDGNGQPHKQVGTAIRTDDSEAAVADVWFTTNAALRDNRIEVPIEFQFGVADLPNAKAFGNLLDLRQAMSLDSTLKGLVESYVALQGTSQQEGILRTLIFQWAGVTQIASGSRGVNVDARELAVVELLSGRRYSNQNYPTATEPRVEAGNLLTGEFNKFMQFVGAQIKAQTVYADAGIFLGGFSSDYTQAIIDWDALKQAMLDAYGQANGQQVRSLVVLATALVGYSPSLSEELKGALAEVIGAAPGIDEFIVAVDGGNGADTLYGSEGRDWISGGQGNDSLYGQAGDDVYMYRPGDGNDWIFDSKGVDQLYFRGGILPEHLSLTRDVSSIIVRVSVGGVVGEIRINNVFEGTNGALREGLIESFRFENGTIWDTSQVLAAIAQPATSGDDGLYGSAASDTFSGGSGNDDLAGYGGDDALDGGAGNDTLSGGTGDDVLIGGFGRDRLTGGAGSDTYVFNIGDGDDLIDNYDLSAGRVDVLQFGAGIVPGSVIARRSGEDLVLTFEGSGDRVTVASYFINGVSGYQIDEIRFADETVWDVATIKALVLAPTDGDDVIKGYAGDDVLSGGLGNDTLSGGAGSDTYVFNAGDGQDTINNYDVGANRLDVLSFGAGILPANVTARRSYDDLVLTFAGSDDRVTVSSFFYGDGAGAYRLDEVRFADGTVWNVNAIRAMVIAPTDGDDVIKGYGGDDVLSGGLGNDILSGGAGSDTYLFSAGDGQDTINNYDYGANRLDVLSLGAGILPANVTARRSGDDLVLTFAGSDDRVTVSNFFYGDGAGDYRLDEVRFADGTVWNVNAIRAMVIAPTDGDDVIKGYGGDDVLSGGLGNDTLSGGAGSDTYLFNAGDGQDTIENYDYGANRTDVLALGVGIHPANVSAQRSDDDLILTFAGNDDRVTISRYFVNDAAGAYRLDEIRFADGTVWDVAAVKALVIAGTDGDDVIKGYGGDDVLSGGLGNDTLSGGAGSDTYLFNTGDGQDTIDNYDSGVARVDVLSFGTGIVAADVAARRSGNDLVLTFAGNDDRVTVPGYFIGEGAGSYRLDEIRFADGTVWDVAEVKAKVLEPTDGIDILQGYATGDYLFGAAGDDSLSGGGGNDVLEGGTGNDVLDGGAGSDTYVFNSGDGQDTINNYDATVGRVDVLSFGSGILPASVTARRTNTNDLVLTFVGSSDQVTVTNYFYNDGVGSYRLDEIRFNDGTVWNVEAVKALALAPTDGNDELRGYSGDDVISGGAGDDALFGYSGNDRLTGGVGNDYLDGGVGDDVYYFAAGDGQDTVSDNQGLSTIQLGGIPLTDVYLRRDGTSLVMRFTNSTTDEIRLVDFFDVWGESALRGLRIEADGSAPWLLTAADVDSAVLQGTSLDDEIYGNWTDNTIVGLAGDDALYGSGGADILEGGAGNDVLDGGYGADQLVGGSGDDTYWVNEADDVIIEQVGEGTDIVRSTAYSYTLAANVEHLTLVEGSDAYNGIGNALDNVLTGNSNDNRMDGGTGADVMIGGDGNDTYAVDDAGDVIVENAGEGTDTVEAVVSYALVSNVENLTLLGTANLDATGNTGDNVIRGNAGNNRIEGGAGADTLYGGAGDDYYVAVSASDRVYEYAGEGIDTVERAFETNLVLDNNVENLVLGTGITTGNGNGLDNTITGNAGGNTLAGLDGNDTLHGLDGNDALFGGNGTDALYGGAGDDYLDGGTGIDQMEGGVGNDNYIVDHSDDVVVEAAGAGTDQIQASASYALSANVENLFLTGSAAINGTGNALDNYIAGNGAANTIHGGGGNDTIVGGGGNDTLIGGTGDDKYIFDAGSGSDVVDNADGGFDGIFFTNGITRERLSFSRDGDDLLIFVDASSTPSVRVLNHFLGGDAAIDYVQPDGGYYLTTTEINQIVAGGSTGGEYDQVIEGTAAGEQLVGSSGKDLIKGLAGDDQLFGMGGNDTLQGGEGNDYLAGGSGNGTGSGDDVLEGGAGNDTLRGEDGSNTLAGGAGDDQYVYGGGIDVIDNTGGGTDWLFFQNGITASQLAFTRDGDDLVITVNGNASQRVTVTGHFLGGDMALDYLQPASGSVLDTAAINALVTTGGGGDTGGGTPGTGNDADYPSQKTGTAAGEQIIGTSGRDLIKGLGGDDTLFGMGADDKLDGGDGNDYLSGGSGSFSGSGNDILIGGAGNDQLVGEDGDDMLFGGAGDDVYFYAAGSGVDTVDNTGGGTDLLYFDAIDRARLTYHRDGDDLIVRMDGDAGQQMRVLDHFLGGEHAIAYVQPGDGGYAISAATIAGQLTPLGSASRMVSPMSLAAASAPEALVLPADEIGDLALAIEAFSFNAPSLQAPSSIDVGFAPSTRWPSGSSIPQASLSPSVDAAGPPLAELHHLVDSLASFAGQAMSSPANDTGFEELPGVMRAAPSWKISHRNDGLRLRQMEL